MQRMNVLRNSRTNNTITRLSLGSQSAGFNLSGIILNRTSATSFLERRCYIAKKLSTGLQSSSFQDRTPYLTSSRMIVYDQRRYSYKVRIIDGIIHSPFPDVDLPEMSLTDYVLKDFDKFGNRPALIESCTGKVYTFSNVRDSIHRVSSGLSRHGVTKGDIVLMISANNCEFIIVYHAVIALGATVTFINCLSSVDDVIKQAQDAGVTYIYTDSASLDTVTKACKKLDVKKTFVLGQEDGHVTYNDLVADDGSARPHKVTVDVLRDVAMLPYSSGTTGLPKGVMIQHYSTVSNVQQFDLPDFWPEREGAVHLAVLPFYHLFAIFMNFSFALALGQTSVVLPRFEPDIFFNALEKYKVSLLVAVPPMLVFMCKSPLASNYDLSSLKRVVVGAAPLADHLVEDFQKICPGATVGQVYGMTETGPIITCNPLTDCSKKPGSVGLVVPNTQVKFVNLDTRKICAPNENGELWSRGPQNMIGYLNRPEATAETIDKDGFLHTGDIGYYDKEGHIYIVDRVKELVKYKGYQVAPAELEALLLAHPAVADAGVTGVPDEEAGELPKGYVVLKQGQSATATEIQEYVAGKVVPPKKLRGGVEIISQIPKTASGKILRRELKKMAVESKHGR